MKKIICCSVCILFAGRISAQTLSPFVISSSGAFYTSSSAMLSTTIGEMTMVETFSSTANFLTQGFQQPEDLGVGIIEHEIGSNMFALYPNPAIDVVMLQANFTEKGSLQYSIFNALGQKVMSDEIVPVQGIVSETINIAKLCPGIYFVKAEFISTSDKKQSYTQKLTIQK